MTLPGLELADGVPTDLRTLVAVPTLLTSEADLLEQIERLEVHHLAGAGGDLSFALLSDGVDADQEVVDGDARLLAVAAAAIARLNRRHGPGRAAIASCCCIAVASSIPARTAGWGGSASAASCTS